MISNSITSRPTSSLVATYTTSESKAQGDSTAKPSTQISTLASQLAASAARADVRDKTLSRTELANEGKRLLSQIQGEAYAANKAKHDLEVPKTDDPALLARAKQATEFVNRTSNQESAKNPFAGLSREQLSHIVYDDSGTYTVNERRAASYEADQQEEAWRQQVCAKAMNEYNSTGKLTQFFSSCLDHFKQLPAIEQAQYPADYASDLQSKVDLDFNYRTHQAEGKRNSPQSLIDAVLPMQSKEPSPKPAAQDKGMAIVNQRLYGGQANTPVLSAQIHFNSNSPLAHFLSLDDREMLGEMYVIAQQEGAALEHVDAIAYSLGRYRSFDNGKILANFNNGQIFDTQGHVLTVDFSEKDAVTAARIRNSDAINSCKIDRGFLNFSLDPGWGAMGNMFELDFMEQMVNRLSTNGDTAQQLDRKFSSFTEIPIQQKARLTASKEVVFQPPVADFTSIDGVGHWRTPELEAAAKGKNLSALHQPTAISELINDLLSKIRHSDRDKLMQLHSLDQEKLFRKLNLKL